MTDTIQTMFAALIDAEGAMFNVLSDDGFATPADRETMRDALFAVRAAIAKATGKEQTDD